MKAAVYEQYGTPDEIEVRMVERPTPKSQEVLVKVHTASINSWDWDLLRGRPLLFRFWGMFRPRHKILGADIAGRVAAIGDQVTRFQVGDEVFGDLCQSGWGGFAEYACAQEDALERKPASLTFAQAASLPQAGVMALQGVQDYGDIQPGQSVLINGACGGVGTLAIQLAKSRGAEVTGVDRTEKLDRMRTLGADHVVDFTREDFTRTGSTYDLILDVAGYHSIFAYARALRPKGKYFMIGGPTSTILQSLLLGPLLSLFSSKKLGILAHEPNRNLQHLASLVDQGKLDPIIDRTFSLDDTAEGLRHFGNGLVQGKALVTMED